MVATARTSVDSADSRLAGRTYAIPFVRVWDASLDLVRSELRHWYARWWDEEAGVIQALSRGAFLRRVSDVVIRIKLDEQAQTRVDLRSTSRFTLVGDLGGNTRLINGFTKALDRKLTQPRTAAASDFGSEESGGGERATRRAGDSGSAGAPASGGEGKPPEDGARPGPGDPGAREGGEPGPDAAGDGAAAPGGTVPPTSTGRG